MVLESIRFMNAAIIYLKVKCLNSPKYHQFNHFFIQQTNKHTCDVYIYLCTWVDIHYNGVRVQWQEDTPPNYYEYENKYLYGQGNSSQSTEDSL